MQQPELNAEPETINPFAGILEAVGSGDEDTLFHDLVDAGLTKDEAINAMAPLRPWFAALLNLQQLLPGLASQAAQTALDHLSQRVDWEAVRNDAWVRFETMMEERGIEFDPDDIHEQVCGSEFTFFNDKISGPDSMTRLFVQWESNGSYKLLDRDQYMSRRTSSESAGAADAHRDSRSM